MAKTYDRHEVGKKISALLKIVLFRDDSDTVLTATNEFTSKQNEDAIIAAPIANKKTKASKLFKKKTIKQNPISVEKVSTIFKEK